MRRHCLRTSRSASSAPRFSNLLSAISSAKSSMSIFSSWLAAPYSLVITYIGTSTRSTISESLWPMPAVSTTTRSKPAYLSRFNTSASTALVARFCRRVASERMKTCSCASEFMRMRSPSSAPPLRRRVGSMATTAIVRSGKWRTKRISSSSVRLDLPAPPVPVMPITGGRVVAARDGLAQRLAQRRVVVAVLERRDRPRDLLVVARADRAELEARALRRCHALRSRRRSCRRGRACGRPRASRCARRRRRAARRSRAERSCRRRRRSTRMWPAPRSRSMSTM